MTKVLSAECLSAECMSVAIQLELTCARGASLASHAPLPSSPPLPPPPQESKHFTVWGDCGVQHQVFGQLCSSCLVCAEVSGLR